MKTVDERLLYSLALRTGVELAIYHGTLDEGISGLASLTEYDQ